MYEPERGNVNLLKEENNVKKLLAIVLTLALLVSLGVTAFADDEPIHLTLWTFQELHTQLYKEMLDKWNANPDNPKLDIEVERQPGQSQAGHRHAGLSL